MYSSGTGPPTPGASILRSSAAAAPAGSGRLPAASPSSTVFIRAAPLLQVLGHAFPGSSTGRGCAARPRPATAFAGQVHQHHQQRRDVRPFQRQVQGWWIGNEVLQAGARAHHVVHGTVY